MARRPCRPGDISMVCWPYDPVSLFFSNDRSDGTKVASTCRGDIVLIIARDHLVTDGYPTSLVYVLTCHGSLGWKGHKAFNRVTDR